MSSTIVRRLGAAVSVSALALTLSTVPSSAAESPQPFGATSKATEGPREGRLATGADLQGANSSASRSSASAEIMATAANVIDINARSGVLNNPDYNYIDISSIYVSDSTDLEAIDSIDLRLSVDGKSRGYFTVYEDEVGKYVEVPDTIGLGKSQFTASRINYTDDARTPTIDGTNSNYVYVRRDISVDDLSYTLSPSGKTKTFNVVGMKIYSPSLNDFTALSKVKLQYKTSSGWKTKKTIYLDDDGNGSYSFVRTTKFYYRLVYGTTSTFIGFNSGPTPKI